MTSLTIQLQDDSLVEKAARVARAQKTSVDAMIGGFLASLTDTSGAEDNEQAKRQKLVEELEESFRLLSRPMGGKGYVNRDELYERA